MVTKNLKSQENHGWTAGFRNMLRKENARWWNLKSLAIQFILWLLILNSLVAAVMYLVPSLVNSTAVQNELANSTDPAVQERMASGRMTITQKETADAGLGMFFNLAGLAVFMGAIIFGHDAILKERESGTAAWLLSKPISRKAFVLSKVLSLGIKVIVIVLLAQAIVTYAMCSFVLGSPMPVLPFLAGLCVLGLGIMFYLALAISLGAFSLSRGVTLGLPMIIGLIGGIVLGLRPEVHYFTPWELTRYATIIAGSGSLPSDFFWPIIATVIWMVLFIGAATVRFDHTEL